MSNYKYTFCIQNYHAIENADITLNGITVLAGINGCGKSTIARSLYSIVNTMNDFEAIQKDAFCRSLASEITRANRLLYGISPKWRNLLPRMRRIINDDGDFESNIKELYFSFLDDFARELIDKQSDESSYFIERAYQYLLNEKPEGRGIDYLINAYIDHCRNFYFQQVDNLHYNVKNRTQEALSKAIRQEYPDCDSRLDNIHFSENGIELLDGYQFESPLMLEKALYIDTPMALSAYDEFDGKTVWNRFRALMFNNNAKNSPSDSEQSKIQFIIKSIIGGNIVEINDLSRPELHYKTADGLDIDISEAATGIKSFAYILRLLENGWLNNQTLLIIDEPEAHLHPQWIVEFAKVLVLLQKELGVKVLIASHDPDMVAAIHDMSQYYHISDDTNFYIAENNGEGKYNYKYLGNQIGEIFESFNVALVKIRDYSGEE